LTREEVWRIELNAVVLDGCIGEEEGKEEYLK
jgi:hypothetical protein